MTGTIDFSTLTTDVSVIALLIAGIWQFRAPRSARSGNLTAAFALVFALFLVLYRNGLMNAGTVLFALTAGAVAGYGVARRVGMIQIPAMVAFQHGAGGIAAFLVSLVELMRHGGALGRVNEVSGILGLTIGALTFSASMVASAKLGNKMRQLPQLLPAHNVLALVNLAFLLAVGFAALYFPGKVGLYLLQIVLSSLFGVLVAIRIGGADMPVLISFLNATAGLAAALCGMVIENRLLIAFGATVAASGSILTHVMCRSMNRSLLRVFLPKRETGGLSAEAMPETGAGEPGRDRDPAFGPVVPDNGFSAAVSMVATAGKVIIVPGFGMAVAKAQSEVVALAREMEGMGKKVRYAIHPVAGRMPGHMNVLLAEAGVDYDHLVEMDDINPEFARSDLVLVVGACDVVNPAAMDVAGTPISGMPILRVHEAKHVVCCNFDDQPGYSGVQNPLYEKSHAVLLPGDAKKSVRRLIDALGNDGSGNTARAAGGIAPDPASEAATVLASGKTIVIIPGYGMARARAQFKVAELASLLAKRGAAVKYAIHPVAGRMPGHMNVILAEAEVDYEDLVEMDEANPRLPETDVVVVFGACDVVNPAAMETSGTPISGMPILAAHAAKSVIVCNYDNKPGYSGVENPLYENEKTIFLPGDAKESAARLISSLDAL